MRSTLSMGRFRRPMLTFPGSTSYKELSNMRSKKAVAAMLAAAMVAAGILVVLHPTQASASGPGAQYFTNTPLVTQDGKTVHFFDDLIRGKSVVINFIYTQCGDSCP